MSAAVGSLGLLGPPPGLFPEGSAALAYRAAVLRRGSRTIVRYAAAYRDGAGHFGRRAVIGKAYRRGGAAAAYAVQRSLWAAGFDDARLAVPEPLAYVPEAEMVVMSWSPGRLMQGDLLRSIAGERAAEVTSRLAARWLLKLHAAQVAGWPALSPDDSAARLATLAIEVARAEPRVARRVTEVSRALERELLGPTQGQAVPTHGDFDPKNILVAGERLTVVDLDRAALAHPSRDLGHFLGQSMVTAAVRTGRFTGARSWCDTFIDEYLRGAPPALDALGPHLAFALLAALNYRTVVRPEQDRSFVGPWLDEIERNVGERRVGAFAQAGAPC